MHVHVDLRQVTLESERLLLRPWQSGDLQDFYTYASVEGVGEMAGWRHHRSIDESKMVLQLFIEAGENFAIYHKADRKVIGSLGLHKPWTEEVEEYRTLRAVEIGYALAKDYWGQGLMPEAVRTVLSYCFLTLKVDAVTIGHFVHNPRSKRVIDKSGFRYIRTRFFKAEQMNTIFQEKNYLLTRADWQRSLAST